LFILLISSLDIVIPNLPFLSSSFNLGLPIIMLFNNKYR